MKAKLLLLLTLGLNLVLAGLWFYPPGAKAVVPLPAKPPTPVVAPAAPVAVVTNVSTNVLAFQWARVESDDFRKYIANLRALGCPEQVIRDVVVAELEKLYRQRQQDIQPARYQLEPWAGKERYDAANRQDRAVRTAQEDEFNALVRELLGGNWTVKAHKVWAEEEIVGIMLGFLTDEQAPQVMALVDRSTEQGRRIRDEAGGILIPDDFRRLQAVGDELFADLGRLLLPAEMDELTVRAQSFMLFDGADHRFDTLELTGAEMRAVCRASLALTDVLREEIIQQGGQNRSEEEMARRKAAYEQQLAQILGAERFAEYQLAEDPDYRAAATFLREKHLPKTAAVNVATAFSTARAEAAQLRKDKTLSADERRVALAVVAATLDRQVRSVLGVHAEAFLKANGQLLNELVPPANTGESK